MAKSKKTTIVLDNLKEPDAWGELADALSLDEKVRRAHFQFGDYADIELTVKSDLTFTGRFLPKRR